MSDAALKLHLPEPVLRVHIAKAVERVELRRGKDVRNVIAVADDVDRPGDAPDHHVSVDRGQGLAQVRVAADRRRRHNQDERGCGFGEEAAHDRIIRDSRPPAVPVPGHTLVQIHSLTRKPAPTARQLEQLKPTLDRLYESFNFPDSATDPIQIVRRFPRNDDREIVGFCAAALAFGRVTSVIQSIERLLQVMGEHPAEYVRAFDPQRERVRFDGLVHRWTRAADLVALVWVLKQMLDRSGSLESFFLEAEPGGASDVGPALDEFSRRALSLDLRRAYGPVPARPGVCYFFARPSGGSGCKRLNLFLRWMVRRDALDLGVWSRVSPASLIVPLDTHVIRLCRCLRLTGYTSPGWPMARDITASLRQLDPIDPVKYDFSVCHLGMMNACGFGRPQADSQCPLRGTCRARTRGRRRPAR